MTTIEERADQALAIPGDVRAKLTVDYDMPRFYGPGDVKRHYEVANCPEHGEQPFVQTTNFQCFPLSSCWVCAQHLIDRARDAWLRLSDDGAHE